MTPAEVNLRATSLWSQFLSAHSEAAPVPSKSTVSLSSKWSAPCTGFVKINVDAAVIQGFQRVGIEVVARDDHGLVLFSQVSYVDGVFSTHVAEMLAAREGLIVASTQSWVNIILELDAGNVVDSIDRKILIADDDSVLSSITSLGSKFEFLQALHCRRSANAVVHILASKGLHGSISFHSCSPLFIILDSGSFNNPLCCSSMF